MKYTIEMHETFQTSQSAKNAFEYIVDFSHIDQWDHTIMRSAKVGDAAIALGTQFDLMFAMGKRRSAISYTISKFEPHTKAVLKGISKSFTAQDTVTIDESPQGCHVDWHAKIVFSGLSAFIVPFIAKKIKANGAQTIRDLNRVLDELSK